MMRPWRRAMVVAAGLAFLGLALGCSESDPPEPVGGERPLRILSLTPNITEILFAMGLGDRVVGRSTYCTYPPEALAVPAVGDTIHLGLEKIIRLEPTLAFLVARPEAVLHDATLARLEGLGIRVVPLQADRMDEMLDAIRTLGRETREEEAAQALLDRIQGDLDRVRREVAGLPRPRVLFVCPMSVGSSRVLAAGRGTFVDGLLDVAGAENAYPDEANWPTLSPQQVIALAPDVVIINAVGSSAPPDRVEAIRQSWASLTGVPAVANGRVHILTEPYLTIPGPRVGQAAERLAEVIHPQRKEAPPP